MDAHLEELVDMVARRLPGEPPHVVGIAGAVAVGKSTISAALARAFEDRGRLTAVVTTDAFLLPNAILAERNAVYRKGFPETYDWDAIVAFVAAMKSGATDIHIPVYSHTTYDIAPGESRPIGPADLVLLEGVVALQPPVLKLLDVGVYIDADESAVKSWFADRFVRLTAEARAGADSFYKLFADMSDAEVRAAAEGTWDSINGPNLHEHIEATRTNAMLVVEKAADHSIAAVRETS
jgi:type I pantothenate kinase